ncbi:hypothetical protein [Streptomyces sp. NPDC059979]|uniref:hypothetical protein n=1 Tax=Streptomyces sp. NPDC059979 TaxID=3347021 RepID=UPI0036C83039
MTTETHAVRLRLSFFEDFCTVAGLLRDTGARREASRIFVIDSDLSPAQTMALVQLLEYSRKDANHPVHVETSSRIPNYQDQNAELLAWWGTIADWRPRP